MRQTLYVNSEKMLSKALGDIREWYAKNRYVRVQMSTGKRRSLDQNAISHVWYEQVAEDLREDTALGVKRFCKLTMGVPILRADDAEFRELYDATVKPMPYEHKLRAMDLLDVTSLFDKGQFSQYLEEMQRHYFTRNVRLEFPEQPS